VGSQFFANLIIGKFRRSRFGDNGNIDGCSEPLIMTTEKFTQQSFHAVALNSSPDFPAYSQTKPGMDATTVVDKQEKVRRIEFFPALPYCSKFMRLPQPLSGRESCLPVH
jgi:hypothetical protein